MSDPSRQGRRRSVAWLAGPVLALLFAWLAPGCTSEPTRPPSAVLITLDTTRADALGSYGAPPGLTPALDRIAREGIVYDAARTVAPITLPAHASMLTGLYPPRHGTRDNGWSPLSGAANTLAERARQAGLATGAFVAAVVLDAAYGLDQGFDVYRSPVRPTGGTSAAVPSIPGVEVAEQAADWLAALPPERGFFVWVHLFDPHFPLQPTRPLLERAGGDPYLAAVAAADVAVGRVLQALERTGALDATFLAVVGDHGEGRGDHGESAHGLFAYDSTLRIPFLLRYPDGWRAGTRSDEVVSVVDVFPTLLDALGLEAPGAVDGVSLYRRAVPDDRGAYFESYYGHLQFGWAPLVGWVDRSGKLVHAARSELYDVAADPAEAHDRMGEEGRNGDVGRYRAAIEDVLRSQPLPAEQALAPEIAHQLEQLGYATSGERAPAALVLPDPLADHGLPSPHDRQDEAEAFNAALTAASRGDLDRTIAVLRELLDQHPDNPSALHYLAAALIERGRCPEALALLDRLEAAGRMRPTSLANYGSCLLRMGRARESVPYFERALALDPLSNGARRGLASARERLESGGAAPEAAPRG
jgi:arylsulfatase A-like enzyme